MRKYGLSVKAALDGVLSKPVRLNRITKQKPRGSAAGQFLFFLIFRKKWILI